MNALEKFCDIVKSPIKWYIRHYIVAHVCKMVNARGAKIAMYASKCLGICAILEKFIVFFKSIANKLYASLEDGYMDNCEAEEIVDEAEKITKEVL